MKTLIPIPICLAMAYLNAMIFQNNTFAVFFLVMAVVVLLMNVKLWMKSKR